MTLRTLRFSLILFTGVLMAACSLFSGKQSDTTSIPEPLTQTVREWAPDDTPRGVILGLHSFGDFGAAFEQLGPWFAEAGYVFVASIRPALATGWSKAAGPVRSNWSMKR